MEPHRAEEVLLFHWLLKPVTLHNLPDGHTRSLVEWCGPIQRGTTVAEELRGGLKRCLRQKAMGVLATVGFSRKFIDGSCKKVRRYLDAPVSGQRCGRLQVSEQILSCSDCPR